MDAGAFLATTLTGLASAASMFLIASGLTLIFGVTRVVNFAHGSFYMLGAYAALSLFGLFEPALGRGGAFWLAVPIAAVLTGIGGVVLEMALLRRIYTAPHALQILATFGVILIVQDAVILAWGYSDHLGPRVPGLTVPLRLMGQRFPLYDLFLIGFASVVFVALWMALNRTRWGTIIRAVTADREMAGILGANHKRLFSAMFFIGCCLAGLAGAVQIPREPANIFMDSHAILGAFVTTVIGGLGSLGGAAIAAVLLGLLQAFGILLFPKITLVLVFLVMAVVLMIRPSGLLGRPDTAVTHELTAGPPQRRMPPALLRALSASGLLLLVLPMLVDSYVIGLFTEVLVFALFALSLNMIMGTGGLMSFGHAAYFGLGAYGAGLAVTHLGARMELAMLVGPIVAGLCAAGFGWFIVRRAGVYLAMLTLAVAQIVWSVSFQWNELTGGDNGVLGLWPAGWARAPSVYYYLTLALTAAAIALIIRALYAPFGYTLRAGRDSPLRAEAIGIDVRRHQWLAFTLSGIGAGLAGSIYTFAKGGLDPSVFGMTTSLDGLVMVLIGGIQSITGPLLGSVVYNLLKAYVMPLTDYWRTILGCVIIALVLAFPRGIAGFVAARWPAARPSLKDLQPSAGHVAD